MFRVEFYLVGNLYHELCHRYIHSDYEKNAARLPGTGKAVFFILQNLYFIKNGVFYNSKAELMDHLDEQDKEVFAMLLKLQDGGEVDFGYAFGLLFSWCQNVLTDI